MYSKELWLEHHKSFTAFTADTDTIESLYAEWIVAEAILTHAVRMMAASPTDAARWRALAETWKGKVLNYRALHMPKKQMVKHERPFYA